MMKVILSGLALFMLTSVTGVKAQDTRVAGSFGSVSAVKNGEVNIPVVISGVNPADIHSLKLTVNVAGTEQQMEVTPRFVNVGGDRAVFYVKADAPSSTGLSDVTVTVDAVNGVEAETVETSRGSLMTVSRKVPHRVVIEKYTGMWCPVCPTGIVGIERTKINYGDKVLVLEAHYNDPLFANDYNKVIMQHLTFPRATVDRDPNIGEVNPYLGTERGDNGAKYGLGYDIEEQMAIDPVVDIKVGGGIDGKKITVKSDITSLYTGDANLGVTYVLTQDSLSSPNWKQQNSLPLYYRDNPIIEKEPLFEKWLNGDLEVTDVVFDDVIRAATSPDEGLKDIIPAQVNEEETYTHEYVFDLNKYKKIKSTDYMNLCVFVIDNNTGKIVNSASVRLSDCNAIEGVEAEGENAVEVARYTVDGTRIAVPQSGINIVRYSDGTARKVVVK